MERAEWLKQMRSITEELYDHFSLLYWEKFGLYPNETHREYLEKFLAYVAKGGTILSAACGAGRYDGMLLEAGHIVVGIDQSAGMLARAREHFPQARYEKMGLQEIALEPAYHEAFDGVICLDAMEHVCPEDWPGILRNFQEVLKPGGLLYFTVEVPEGDEDQEAYERAKALGLPVVYGEVADKVVEGYERVKREPEVLNEVADTVVYHYHPPLEQARAWIEEAGLEIVEEGQGQWYRHIVARKK